MPKCDLCGGSSDSCPEYSGCWERQNHLEYRRRHREIEALEKTADATELLADFEKPQISLIDQVKDLEKRLAHLETVVSLIVEIRKAKGEI
ncbi:MAG: hypothetical protein WC824_14820 [Bacteroidota bacterium]